LKKNTKEKIPSSESIMAASNATTDTVFVSPMVSEVEETFARISSHKGVEGILIIDRNGKTTEYFGVSLFFNSINFTKCILLELIRNYFYTIQQI